METVSRYDYGQVTKSETTDEGYLKVWCKAARVGTQLYTRGDGAQVREYRPEEEVAKPESLASFGMKAVTMGHPPVLLDTENTKVHQIGHAGSQVRFSDGFVEIALLITDEKAISAIKRGDAQEVSAGYRVDYDPTPGVTPQGESYDGVQRNIRVNHIAVVPRGRAGREVRLLLDSVDRNDAVAYTEPPSNSPVISMARITLDGLDLEIPAEAAGAVQSFVKDANRANAELQSKLDEQEEQIQAVVTENEETHGRLDAALERIEELEKQVSESETRDDSAAINEAVNERLLTLDKFAQILPEDYKFDGEDERQIMTLAYENVFEKAPREDANEDYLMGVLDGVLAAMEDMEDDEEEVHQDAEFQPEEDGSNVAEVRAAIAAVSAAEKMDASDSYRDRLVNGWKSDLTAHA